ncbi:MAG: hypothetical protein ACI4U5_05745 [Bacilli bacterium]
MTLPEILLIIASVAFVIYIFGKQIYRLVKKLPSDECCSCKKSSKSILKQYHRDYK